MKEEHYYIPSVEEFCLGFEVYLQNLDNAQWGKYTIEEWDFSIPNIGEYCQSGIGEIIEELRGGRVKVKYLDKEDIESFGFTTAFINDMIYGQYKNLEIYIDYSEYTKTIKLSTIDDTLFLGIIKNKNEFQKLLKQLQIN